jgi:hypothetical protein
VIAAPSSKRILVEWVSADGGYADPPSRGYHTRVKAMESSVVRNVVDAHSDSSHD